MADQSPRLFLALAILGVAFTGDIVASPQVSEQPSPTLVGALRRFPVMRIGDLEKSDFGLRVPRVYPRPLRGFSSGIPPIEGTIPETLKRLSRRETNGVTPPPNASFLALADDGSLPPDTMGAAGPNHLVTTLNGQFRIQNKSGVVLSTISDDSFWSQIPVRYHYDPRVIFDPGPGRWIIIEADRDDQMATSGFNMAVSQTNDPTGFWSLYRQPAAAGNWFDFPMIGFNASTVTVSVNVVNIASGASQIDVVLFGKAGLYNGAPSERVVSMAHSPTLCPTTVYDPGVTTNYLVGENFFANGVTLYQATESGILPIAVVHGQLPWSDGYLGGPQLGSSTTIDSDDTRIQNVVLRNGSLWFAHTCFLPSAPQPTRSAIQWWKISTAGRLLDLGRVDDPSGLTTYAFPSIAVNRQDDAVIGFAQFSGSQYASAAYAFRSAGDPPGSFRSPVILKPGEGPFEAVVNRWGDYSSTVIDTDDLSFWTLQEYAAVPFNGAGRWGTWWGHIVADTTASPSCTRDGTTLCLSSNRFAVSATWRTDDGKTGAGQAVALTTDTGYFWFFGAANVEVVVKVLNACSGSLGQRFWVFAGGLTNVNVVISVRDSKTGSVRTYTNPANAAFQPIQDTDAFATCP